MIVRVILWCILGLCVVVMRHEPIGCCAMRGMIDMVRMHMRGRMRGNAQHRSARHKRNGEQANNRPADESAHGAQ